MLPQSHVAYTWLTLSIAQDQIGVAEDADYRLVAMAAMGSDLIDKPLAWAYFYEHHRSAVLFAHTLLAYASVLFIVIWAFPRNTVYGIAFLGHAVLDRIWMFHDTFYWPFRGWRFHIWRKQGSEQEKIGNAYWYAFTRRPELWIWEVGGLLAFAYFIWRHRLYRFENLWAFVLTGQAPRQEP